jgi:hypothetical protein
MAQRVGTPWTKEEESRLLASSSSGVPLSTIAKQHNRTPNAIKMRLERIMLNYILEGKSATDASRLTGIPIQRAGAPTSESQNGKEKVSSGFLQMMSFTHTVSRSELQSVPAKRRLEAIQRYIDNNIQHPVYNAAAAGKTSFLYVMPPNSGLHVKSYPPMYEVTPNDLVEGCTAKFPGCTVTYSEEWVDVRPGVREHRSGIRIDWS